MGREVRIVSENWQHPKDVSGNFEPLHEDEMEIAGERTLYMMYETCTEGTPISPAFKTPEELARWLADSGASAFGNMTASYEAWLRVCRGGYACSAVMHGGKFQSGVEGLKGANE